MNNKIISLIALFAFTTFTMSAAANEPAPVADPVATPAAPAATSTDSEFNERLEKVESQVESHEETLGQQNTRIKRNEAFRLYGTAAFGGIAASGGMFLGYMTAIPVLMVTVDSKSTFNDIHATGFITAGTVAATTTLGTLKLLNANWTTSLIASGATMGTALVGMGAAMYFTEKEQPIKLMAVYPLTIAAAGAVTAGAVVLTSTLEKNDAE